MKRLARFFLTSAFVLITGCAQAQSNIPITQWPVPPSGSPDLTTGDALVITRGGVSYKVLSGIGGVCPSNQFGSGITAQGQVICSNVSTLSGLPVTIGTSLPTPNPFISGDVTSGFSTVGVGHIDVGIEGTNLLDWGSGGEVLQGGLAVGSPTGGLPAAGFINAQGIQVNGVAVVSTVFGRSGAVTAQSGDYNSGQVSESGNLYFTNARAIAATLTGYTSGAGTISSADSILTAIQKLNGNVSALVTGVASFNGRTGAVSPTTGDYGVAQVTGAAPLASPTFTGTVGGTTGNFSGNFTAGEFLGAGTGLTGTASSLTAGNVTTNANLTGPITSVGNVTSIASQTGTGSTFVVQTSPTLVTPNLGTPSALIGTNISGVASALSIGGNAATATALQTPRAINGINFDGTSAITVPAAAGTLTGNTLNSTVINSSLTSVGLLANLTVTNPINGSVTTNANLTGPITSIGNATAIAAQTGTGSTFVMSAAPTITGVVTLSGLSTGVVHSGSGGALSSSTIATADLAASAVTYAKIQNVDASSLLGNPTGAPAVASEITLPASMSFSGSVLQTAAHTGDATSGANSNALTLATVNSNTGAIGSSTAIPVITLDGKGRATAATTAAVVAPAGTLTGTTLASNVISSVLTSVGTIVTGVWNGTAVALGFGGTGASTAATALSNLLGNPASGNYALNCTSGSSCTTTSLTGAGVTTWSGGTTGLTPNSATAGPIVLSGTLGHANGGTDATTLNGAFNNLFETVATTIGDIVYGGASGAPTRLAGNTTTAMQFYTSTGNGSVAAAPALSSGPIAWFNMSGNGDNIGRASFRAYCAANSLTCTSGDQFTNKQNFYMAVQQVFYNHIGNISDASSTAIAQQYIEADVENQFTTTTDPNVCPEHVRCREMGTIFPLSSTALVSPCTVTNWDGSNCHSFNITFTSTSPAGTFGFMPVIISAYNGQYDSALVWAKDGAGTNARSGLVDGWTWQIFGTRGIKGTITGYTNGETVQLAIGSKLEPGGKCTAVVAGGNLTGCTWSGTRWSVLNGSYSIPPAMQSLYWSQQPFINATGITVFDATQTPNNDCYIAKGLTSGTTTACLQVTWWPTLCSGSAGGSGNSSYGSCGQSSTPDWQFSTSAVAQPIFGNVNIAQAGSGNDATQYGQNFTFMAHAQNTYFGQQIVTQGGYIGDYFDAVDTRFNVVNPVTPQIGLKMLTGNEHGNMAVIDTPLATGVQMGPNGGNNLSVGQIDIFQNSAGPGLTGYAIDASSLGGVMGVGLPYAFITNTGTCSGCVGGTAAAIDADNMNGGNYINAIGTNYTGASTTQNNPITTWIHFGTNNAAGHNGLITGYAPENITGSLYNGTPPAGFGLWVWDSLANGFMTGNGAYLMWGAGAPTNGTTGANKTVIGSIYYDTTNGHSYTNTGTKASPTWSLQFDAAASTGTGNVVLSASPTLTGTIAGTAETLSSTLQVTGHTTFEGVTSTGATGTGNLMYSISPTTTGTLTAAAANFSGAVTAVGTVTIGTSTPTASAAALDLSSNTTSSNSSLLLPVGTTAARPTGVNGMIRYDSTDKQIEGFQNGVWSGVEQQLAFSSAAAGTSTFTAPNGVTHVMACGRGGSGGGGGGAGGGGGSTAAGAGGGGAGGAGGSTVTFCRTITVVPGTAYTVTVGAAGVGGNGGAGASAAAGGATGTNGGTVTAPTGGGSSSVGSLITWVGGTNGGNGNAGSLAAGGGGGFGGRGAGVGNSGGGGAGGNPNLIGAAGTDPFLQSAYASDGGAGSGGSAGGANGGGGGGGGGGMAGGDSGTAPTSVNGANGAASGASGTGPTTCNASANGYGGQGGSGASGGGAVTITGSGGGTGGTGCAGTVGQVTLYY